MKADATEIDVDFLFYADEQMPPFDAPGLDTAKGATDCNELKNLTSTLSAENQRYGFHRGFRCAVRLLMDSMGGKAVQG